MKPPLSKYALISISGQTFGSGLKQQFSMFQSILYAVGFAGTSSGSDYS
jgi:hypothetical protein